MLFHLVASVSAGAIFILAYRNDIMKNLSEKTLDKIIKDTIEAMENGKTQIFEIYEAAQTEVKNVRGDIELLKKQVAGIIQKVDQKGKEERLARNKLVRVSSNFKTYTEEDIKICYEETRQIQIDLAVLREQEQSLRNKRNEMEIRLKQLLQTVERAKQLVSQVGVVLGYLSAHMGAVAAKMEEMHQEKMLGPAIIKAQEDERLRISREIHDGPAQMMASVVYRADVCERLMERDMEQAKQELKELREQVRTCLAETRKIIFDLRPMGLDDLGLVATIFHFLEKFEKRENVMIDFRVIGEEQRISKHMEICIFRIIQEAVNNIKKHANTDRGQLVLEYHDDYIYITIEDQGDGFDIEDLELRRQSEQECFGLLGMKERIQLVKGRMTMISKPFEGTKIRILLPVKESLNREKI